MTALKGGAPANTDLIYISEEATVDVDANMSILTFYIGDNVAGTAVKKTGYLIVEAGVTVTLFTTTNHYGLWGEGSTSTITLNGSKGSLATITANTAGKYSNYYMYTCKITATYGNFANSLALYTNNVNNNFNNCTIENGSNGLIVILLPISVNEMIFLGNTTGWYDFTAGTIDYGDWFVKNKISMVGDGVGNNQFILRFSATNGVTRYIRCETSPVHLDNKHRKGLKGVSGRGIKNIN